MKSRVRVLWAAAGAMLLMGFLGDAALAETEPNDDASSANIVEVNTTVDGFLNSVDSTDTIDFYKFTLPGDGYFQLSVTPESELNVEIMLKDADGIYQLGYKNAEGNGGAEGIVHPNMKAGDYYAIVKIPDAIDGVQGNYSAMFSFLAVEEIDPEPNDETAQAAEMPLNGELTGHLGYYGNHSTDVRDFFRITLPQDGALELTVYPDGTANVGLHLYESVIFNRIHYSDNAGKGESEKIERDNLRAGTYIVLVDRREGYGSYNLTSLFTADAAPDDEPNDSVSEAMEINLTEANPSATVQGRLGFYGNQIQDDSDYMKVSIPSYGEIAFVMTMDAGDDLEIHYELWDSGLRSLGNGTSFDGLPAGVYYARMLRTGGYGSYTLEVSHTAKAAPIPVSAPMTELAPNGEVSNIPISEEEAEHWYAVNLPEDGDLSVAMQFDASSYVFMGLYDEMGLTQYKKTYTYWSPNEAAVQVPNMRKGTYFVKVWRADGSGAGTLRTTFEAVTKLDAEPNDEASSLSPVAYNQSYAGHLGYSGNGWRDTVDLYLVDIPEDGALTATATFEPTAYHYLRVYRRTGTTYSEIGGTYGYWNADPHSVSKPNILAGEYVIELKRADGYGSYDLDIQFTPMRSNDPEVNGDDFTRPMDIALEEGCAGHLGYDRNFLMDAADHYRVVLPEDGSLSATFQVDDTAYVYWRIYYSDFKTKVAESFSYWTSNAITIGSSNLKAGVYYIGVERADGYGSYEFYTHFTPQPFIDADENHIASQAESLPLNELRQGSIGYKDLYYRDDVDWLRVDVPASDRYKLSFQSVSYAYFYYELYGANMVSRLSSDYLYWHSSPGGREIDLEAGTYYLKCRRADGYGPYTVRLGTLDGVTTGTLTGQVASDTGFPLAEISVKVLDRVVQTNAAGQYTIENLYPGQFDATFSSGSKYYSETAQAAIQAGEITTLNVTLLNSNKTAPRDAEFFFGKPDNQYIHFFWSASVSPDVADGGGYKLYIDNEAPIDIGNALQYRSLGYENGAAYTCRLTVYDKYGNESAGKTIVVTPTGEAAAPTPTPTTPAGQPTATPTPTVSVEPPTPTPTPQPGVTPTPTNTPAAGQDTPTPAAPAVEEPSMVYEFDQLTLADDGWMEIPGGFQAAEAGEVYAYQSFSNGDFPSSEDQLGLAVTTRPGEVAFIYLSESINTGGLPALIRCKVKSTAPNAAIAVGALKGSLSTGENLDGTIGFSNILSAASFVEGAERICVIFRPDAGEIINPFIQVAGSGVSAVTVWIDRVDVFILEPDANYSGELFGDMTLY